MGLFRSEPHEITGKAIRPEESLGEYFTRIASDSPEDAPPADAAE
jgi:hypothetical protein